MSRYDQLTPREALEQWQQHCAHVQQATDLRPGETPRERERRLRRLRSDYAAFVDYYFPHYTVNPRTGQHTPCAPFHIKAAKEVKANKNLRAVYQWHRGAAKSTHLDIFIPLWLKAQEQRELGVMVLVGKSEDNACTLLADLQAELQYNQRYIADYGEQRGSGSWEEGEFVTKDGTAFFARGRGQSPRGLRYRSSRPDYIVIDDLDDDELCQNPSRVSKLTDWVKEALFGSLDGGRGRFIMVGNLISKTSVLAAVSSIKNVSVSRVNILDRDGNVSWAAKWTRDEVREIEEFQGYRSFQKEYMNNPIVEGAVFRSEWIRWAHRPAWRDFEEILLYIDPSWKSTQKNDYKAAKLWGKTRSGQLWHLRAFVRQATVGELVRWCYDLHEWAQEQGIAIRYYIEANFMQDMLLQEYTTEGELRHYQLPILADRRKKPDKFQRIETSAALWERGIVYYDESQRDDPDMLRGLDQTLAFEKGMRGHDDAPDADEGATSLLQRHSRTNSFTPSFGRRTNSKNILW